MFNLNDLTDYREGCLDWLYWQTSVLTGFFGNWWITGLETVVLNTLTLEWQAMTSYQQKTKEQTEPVDFSSSQTPNFAPPRGFEPPTGAGTGVGGVPGVGGVAGTFASRGASPGTGDSLARYRAANGE